MPAERGMFLFDFASGISRGAFEKNRRIAARNFSMGQIRQAEQGLFFHERKAPAVFIRNPMRTSSLSSLLFFAYTHSGV